MSGHSKWHSIKHKKGANDAARGKIFTRHAKLITLAARQGGDPEMNPSLRFEIERAKAANTPNANIERAIKKGTGDDKNSATLMELNYEGYAPGGVAILIDALTDNKNRTVTGVRIGFSRNGGNMGEGGSVAWMFERKGIIVIDEFEDAENIEMIAIENDAEDIKESDGVIEIICAPNDIFVLKKALEDANIIIASAQVSMFAENKVAVDDLETAQKIIYLVEALEEDEDITAVHTNAHFSQEVIEALENE